jgi:hypothetical protein
MGTHPRPHVAAARQKFGGIPILPDAAYVNVFFTR